jgi:predicted transcriptional regulator
MTAPNVDQLIEVSQVMGSAKRSVLLMLLNGKPMSYTQIEKGFKKFEIKIGSSEIYKHLEILLNFKYVAKRGKVYLVTLKGKKLIEGLEALVDVPPTVPRLEMVF